MSSNDIAVFAERVFFCAVSATISGSILTILTGFMSRFAGYRNSNLNIIGIKSAIIMYLVPISVVFVIGSKVNLSVHGFVWSSVFWNVTTTPMQKLYLTLFGIWLFGLGFAFLFRTWQYLRLREILLGNIPVEDPLVIRIFEEYKESYSIKKVRLYQNDMIAFPIVTGFIEPVIILPVKMFDEKTIRMVLEHEFCHILNRDLWWKKVCLLATFIHWWNPFVYILIKRLCKTVETECDIKTCKNTIHFTMKEYGSYLAGLDEKEDNTLFLSALSKPNDDLYRRLESMIRRKNYKRIIALLCCVAMSIISVIPSYAATESIANMSEKWIEDTELLVEDTSTALVEHTATTFDDNVIEIDISPEDGVVPYGTSVTLDYTIKANTRVTYRWVDMEVNDRIMVTVSCSNTSASFAAGIRDNAGNLRYVNSSNGSVDHIFVINADGEYSVYIQNKGNSPIQVTGTAYYAN